MDLLHRIRWANVARAAALVAAVALVVAWPRLRAEPPPLPPPAPWTGRRRAAVRASRLGVRRRRSGRAEAGGGADGSRRAARRPAAARGARAAAGCATLSDAVRLRRRARVASAARGASSASNSRAAQRPSRSGVPLAGLDPVAQRFLGRPERNGSTVTSPVVARPKPTRSRVRSEDPERVNDAFWRMSASWSSIQSPGSRVGDDLLQPLHPPRALLRRTSSAPRGSSPRSPGCRTG